ncbi:flagellar hook protein FlgK [Pontibacillus chungwhensis BH030062]|uniref:Flagellar hook-associated protein 1 n=1 Tax=Pontibacillus chungwhensis BH030062 TaxID=1385513 RepID=A0A0A2UU28_9BACI|nr:flagellar hook-associated protein FlgK [Pontibacillus chungwhensis]KGP91404.1 flagellar hook protein FlgK [Pontibacillus chungwhensis BH030062]
MGSTFNGIEVAKRAMYAQQSALYTTGHNISNANTPGYSRQRVNFEQTAPYPPASRNRPEIPGQVGSGVEAGTIERVRESFLDAQFRGENTKAGYWSTKAEALQKMEEIMNEPSENGLSKTMDQFWQSLQDLAVNPEDSGARSVVRQRGVAVAETFNYLSSSLNGIQKDFKNQIDVTTKEINSIATQINNINNQIGEIEPHGYLPNDLYDERDRLVDDLTKLVDVKVTNISSGESSLDIAEGKYNIEIVGSNGQNLFKDQALVDAKAGTANTLAVSDKGVNGSINSISLGTESKAANEFTSIGKFQSLVEAHGYEDASGDETGLYPGMITELDNMAYTFAEEFNNVHKSGQSLHEIDNSAASDIPFFTEGMARKGYASNMGVSKEIMESVSKIAASTSGAKGDGDNALNLAGVGSTNLDYDNTGSASDFTSYYEGVIGEMAVQSQEARRLEGNSETLKQSVEERRESVSGVSLDEEMSNMIKYQHAYNAAARNLTTIDEMLDKVINGMGRVGR